MTVQHDGGPVMGPVEVPEVTAASPPGLYTFDTESGASYLLAITAEGSIWMSRTAGPETTTWGPPARYRDGEAVAVRIEHLTAGDRAVLWFVKQERYDDPLYIGTRRETTPVQRIKRVGADSVRHFPNPHTADEDAHAVD